MQCLYTWKCSIYPFCLVFTCFRYIWSSFWAAVPNTGDFCLFFRLSVCPLQALSGLKSALPGLKSAFLGLKSALSGLESSLSGLKFALSGLKPILSGLESALSEKAAFRPERSDFRPERAWGADGRTDRRKNELKSPVFYRTLSPLGPLPCLIPIYNHAKQGNWYRWPRIALGRPVFVRNCSRYHTFSSGGHLQAVGLKNRN